MAKMEPTAKTVSMGRMVLTELMAKMALTVWIEPTDKTVSMGRMVLTELTAKMALTGRMVQMDLMVKMALTVWMEPTDKMAPMGKMVLTELMAKTAPQVSQAQLVQPIAPIPATGPRLAVTAKDRWSYTITALTGL
jgi:hypothetical protein